MLLWLRALRWQRSESPKWMLSNLDIGVLQRKLRLFGVACCRFALSQQSENLYWGLRALYDYWRLMPPGCCEPVHPDELLRVAEEFADGGAWADLDRMNVRVWTWYSECQSFGAESMFYRGMLAAIGLQYWLTLPKIEQPAGYVLHGAQSDLLREIFGNPFRPVAIDSAWRTSTALALAEGIYADRAFDRLPILADALEDAGCDHPDILQHCRGDGPHVRGCWVVDLILGKS